MKIEVVKKGDRRVLPFKKKKGNADGWGVQTIAEDGLLVILELTDSNAAILTREVLASFNFFYRKPKEKPVEVVKASSKPLSSGRKRTNPSK
jgi:hypothetical protein